MTPRQVALGADVLTGLVAVSVAAALGNLVWHLVMSPREPHAIVTRSRAPVAAGTDIAPFVALAPFGSSAPLATGGAGQSLILRGIMLANPATLSTALIADGEGHVVAYRIGQQLPGGATLTAIARDQVTLQGTSGPIRLGFARAHDGTGAADEPSVAVAAAEAAGQAVDQTVVLGGDQDAPPPPPPPPSGQSQSPGVAAIRALIPPGATGDPRPPQGAPQPAPESQVPPQQVLPPQRSQ